MTCEESDIPSWLNETFFENILRTREKDSTISVDSLQVSLASGKGEHYASIIFRGKFNSVQNGNKKRYNVIIKAPYEENELANDIFKQYNFFGQEMEMYDRILPECQKLLATIDDHSQISPQSLFCDYEKSVFVCEDLSAKGFQMADRKTGLDRQHIELVLKKIAKLHATSIAIEAKSRYNLKKFDTGIFNRKTSAFTTYFLTSLDALVNCISRWKDYEYYVEKLIKLRPHFEERARQMYEPNENDFNVLIHGDLWTNNLLYKYSDEHKPIDVQIVDYQLMCWAPAAIDLHFLFNTSLKEDLKRTIYDELVQFYHLHLSDTLKKLGLGNKVPTLHELQISMLKNEFSVLTSGLIEQPVMILDDEYAADADFNALLGLDSRSLKFKENLYKNEKIHSVIRYLLPRLDQKGLLDC